MLKGEETATDIVEQVVEAAIGNSKLF